MRMQHHRRPRCFSRIHLHTYMSLRTERWKYLLDNRRDTAQELELPRVDRRVAIDFVLYIHIY